MEAYFNVASCNKVPELTKFHANGKEHLHGKFGNLMILIVYLQITNRSTLFLCLLLYNVLVLPFFPLVKSFQTFG